MRAVPWLVAPIIVAAAVGAPVPPRVDSPADVDRMLEGLRRDHPDEVRIDELGRSRQGRGIPVVRVARGLTEPESRRPALLLVAGLDSRYGSTPRIAVEAVRRLLEGQGAAALERTALYVVPCLNPDAFAASEPRSPFLLSGRTTTPDDADRDGRLDEDGPVDLNGDGAITLMRVRDPDPSTGLTATLVVDTDDPRLLRTADRARGERPTHALLVESRDADGDGAFGEDGPGGVALDWNFPHRWPEFRDGAGVVPLSEPESLAMVRWALAHEELAAVLVLGGHDNVLALPEGGKMDATGRVPLGVEADDRPLYEDLARAFKRITGVTGTPKASRLVPSPPTGLDGTLHGWTYAQLGVPSLSTPLWYRADLVKPPEARPPSPADAGSQPGTGSDAGTAPPEAPGEPEGVPSRPAPEAASGAPEPRADSGPAREGSPPRERTQKGGDERPKDEARDEDAAWLAALDKRDDGVGFIEWTTFAHPQLGTVEIGGLPPGSSTLVPDTAVPGTAEHGAAFLAELLQRLPSVRLDLVPPEPLGPGLWRVRARLVNDGYLPTATAMAERTRRLPPILVSLDVPAEVVVAGDRVQRVPSVPGAGGVRAVEWIVAQPDGARLQIVVRSPLTGERRTAVDLRRGQQEGGR